MSDRAQRVESPDGASLRPYIRPNKPHFKKPTKAEITARQFSPLEPPLLSPDTQWRQWDADQTERERRHNARMRVLLAEREERARREEEEDEDDEDEDDGFEKDPQQWRTPPRVQRRRDENEEREESVGDLYGASPLRRPNSPRPGPPKRHLADEQAEEDLLDRQNPRPPKRPKNSQAPIAASYAPPLSGPRHPSGQDPWAMPALKGAYSHSDQMVSGPPKSGPRPPTSFSSPAPLLPSPFLPSSPSVEKLPQRQQPHPGDKDDANANAVDLRDLASCDFKGVAISRIEEGMDAPIGDIRVVYEKCNPRRRMGMGSVLDEIETAAKKVLDVAAGEEESLVLVRKQGFLDLKEQYGRLVDEVETQKKESAEKDREIERLKELLRRKSRGSR
ncbi:hypothetical protein VTL71DRAFT_2239 [Oculimacula yallundae]|uniref:Uncharacterized protein n=1 Tax=Oculimacula yallundae TaxID=86028 RepID=A0ABR4C8C3_9HELO